MTRPSRIEDASAEAGAPANCHFSKLVHALGDFGGRMIGLAHVRAFTMHSKA